MTLYGLDPESRGQVATLTDSQLRGAREAMAPVTRAAQGVLDRLFLAVGDAGCCVLLCDATGVPVPQTAFVSCNSWDALAATWFGYQTLWVNRNQLPFEELGTQPLYTGSSLRDVLALPLGGKPA